MILNKQAIYTRLGFLCVVVGIILTVTSIFISNETEKDLNKKKYIMFFGILFILLGLFLILNLFYNDKNIINTEKNYETKLKDISKFNLENTLNELRLNK